MINIYFGPWKKICCYTYFLTPKYKVSAIPGKTTRNDDFLPISPGLSSASSSYVCVEFWASRASK